jgi:putative DNA primase/helicase
MSNELTYLVVPFREKDLAKAAGAKWDRSAGAWYAPPGTNLTPLSQWLTPPAPALDPQSEFADALRARGLRVTGLPEMDGKIHRVPVDGDTAGKRSGAYAGFLDGHPAGYIENYRDGVRVNWKSSTPAQALTDQDRARLQAEAALRQQERADNRLRTWTSTAVIAETAWEMAQAAEAHPYLDAKGIPPGLLRTGAPDQTIETIDIHGEAITINLEGRLLVPLHDIDGRQWSMQAIDEAGRKSFLTGGRVQGCHTLLGEIEADKPLIIAEGYATAATIHELTGLPVIAAFNAGNIAPVAQDYRARYPEQTIIIAGDDDHQKAADKNVGRLKAEAAAVEVGGFTMLPDFAVDDPGTDWNDYAATHGAVSTTQALHTGIRAAQAQALAAELHVHAEQAAALSHDRVEEQQQEEYAHRDAVTSLLDREEEQELAHGLSR